MFCWNCGRELIGKPEICPACGARVDVTAKPAAESTPVVYGTFCSACGASVNPQAVICLKCGAELGKGRKDLVKTEEPDISPKSRLATTLLAIFLGEFGAHRFYIGKKGSAVCMLLLGIAGVLTWVFVVGFIPLIIVGIWALVDFIFAVSGHMRDSKGRLINKWRAE